MSFKAPYLNKEMVWKKVEEFRSQYERAQNVPTDILDLTEFDLDLEIIPIQDLQTNVGVDALLLGDRSGIWIDKRIFETSAMQNRLRFSIAHEIGHLVLHDELYHQCREQYHDKEGWKRFMDEIPEREHAFIEYQAHEFAGRLLVPYDCLKRNYDEVLTALKSNNGINVEVFDVDMLNEYAAIPLAKKFHVSEEAMKIRLRVEDV